MSYAVALGPIEHVDATLSARLGQHTRRSPEEWRDLLVIPQLPRVLFTTADENEARHAVSSIRSAGVFADVVPVDDVENACEHYFTAVFAERSPDGAIVFIDAGGTELKIGGPQIRFVGMGKARMPGGVERFVAIGLKVDPGAIVVRAGAELSRVVAGARSELDAMAGLVAAVQHVAPHARVAHGLDELGTFPGLELFGGRDVALAIVVAAHLARVLRIPQQREQLPPAMSEEEELRRVKTGNIDDLRKPKSIAPIALDRRGAASGIEALRIPEAKPPEPEVREPREPMAGGAKKLLAALVGIVLITGAVVAWRTLVGPESATFTLRANRDWSNAWGAVFRYEGSSLQKVGGIDVAALRITVTYKGESETVEVPSHLTAEARETLGIRWRVTGFELTTESPDWLEIEATRPPR